MEMHRGEVGRKVSLISYLLNSQRMSHRKQRETNQQPTRDMPSHQLSCWLVSLRSWCDILNTSPEPMLPLLIGALASRSWTSFPVTKVPIPSGKKVGREGRVHSTRLVERMLHMKRSKKCDWSSNFEPISYCNSQQATSGWYANTLFNSFWELKSTLKSIFF